MIRIEKQALAAGEGVVRRGGGGNDDGKVDDGDGCMEEEEGVAVVLGNDWVE